MRSRFAMTIATVMLCGMARAADINTVNSQATYYIQNGFAISWAYPYIKLDAAYNRGWTGKGVTVAVFDTGLDVTNAKFSNKVAGTYDIYTGGAVKSDPGWHGTFVSSIIAANRQNFTTTTMYGVASDARIYAVRVLDTSGAGTFTDRQLSNGINMAIANGSKVFNNSWGPSVSLAQMSTAQRQQFVASIPNQLNSWATASGKGIINVWAAGNNGLKDPHAYATLPELDPRLKGSWLVAVALDTNGQIASWSNRCGIAASYCLAAPGGSIVGVYQNGVAVASGTSFAAPMVSGGAALLVQQWPYLTGTQITSILLRTANKNGVYGNSAIYGAGLMDLDAATRPVGTAVVPVGTTIKSASLPLSSTGVALGPIFGQVSSSKDILVLDDYGRAYGIGVKDVVQTATSGVNTQRAVSRLQDGDWTMDVSSDVRMGLVDDASMPSGDHSSLLISSLGTPYMAMGDGRKLTIRQGDVTAWVTQVEGRDALDSGESKTNLPSAQGIAYRWGDVDLGMMAEQNSLFGYATGSNGLGANAVTAFMGWHKDLRLNDAWTLDLSASGGQTIINNPQGLVHEVSAITSVGATVGLSTKNVLRQDDRLGVSVGLPTTVTSGTASLDIPVSRDFDGNISYDSDRLDLSGSTNRQDLQAYWKADLGHGAAIGISSAVLLREGTVADTLTIANLKLRF